MGLRTLECALKAVQNACWSIRTCLVGKPFNNSVYTVEKLSGKIGSNSIQSVPRPLFGSSLKVGLGVLLAAESAHVFFSPRALCVQAKDTEIPNGKPCKKADDECGSKEDSDDEKYIDLFVETIGKAALRAGFGGLLGFCAGYAAKQVTKVVVLTAGVLFIILQGLAYAGFININWTKLKAALMNLVSSEKNGQVSTEDLKGLLKGTFSILQYNLPQATSFVPGFYYGFTY
mmetsp:Transcript_10033/g.13655  ORF Transcript_10033/g.13655 Transcript_10033/m.13655 type:complete len:231 (+) Transcript_10033:271-963(+)|eukprot:CAMPEP_0196600708 /NCGR_PEP_ID=MMETSP1081-20130531/95528_1 /TAXON_ID=36882 /ORGANISM="Pyramimonas amylifera, Strain CCMP720" /LENGTH=230 /DNA_ID=CAMNT_0041926559 /DNA_START=271 /DNA_END=963 /DNA_ORIENTATION=-